MSLKSKVEKMPGYNSLVKPLHFAQAVMAGMKTGWPAKKLRVIAVTGTNGKTTTCFMIWKMLNEAGYRTGILSTVGWATGADDLQSQVEHMTTEKVEILDERMRKVRERKAEFLVLEVTSHALSQSRILGVPVEIAVLTNITPEHLDYHKTFENYRKAKGRLFKKAKTSVINADDENAEWFERVCGDGKYITYGIKSGVLRAKGVKLGSFGVEYACGDMKIRTQIPGEFNVYNSLAAVAVGQKLGLSNEEIEQGIAALEAVEGRMTRVKAGQDFEVIVDYAHQPDALQKVFDSVRPASSRAISSAKTATAPSQDHKSSSVHCSSSSRISSERDAGFNPQAQSRIISVHGGAGRRDHGTREPRGEILGRESDIVIITEDDTRDENPEEIAAMFVKGAEKTGKVLDKDLFVELDREKAIRKAIGMAKTGDIVLILGKGHEKTILRADGAHEFEDIKVAEKVIKEFLPPRNKGIFATKE